MIKNRAFTKFWLNDSDKVDLGYMENATPNEATPVKIVAGSRDRSEIYPREYVDEAQLLLAYAARNGLDIDKTVVTDIVQAKRWLDQQEWNAEREIHFWTAFNTLAKKVHPVSVASLKATHSFRAGKAYADSPAKQTVSFYQKWSVFILVLLLMLQIYWLVGSMRFTSIAELPKKIEELTEQLELEESRIPTEKRTDSREIMALEKEISRYDYLIRESLDKLTTWNPTQIFKFSEEKVSENTSKEPVWGRLDLQMKDVRFVLEVMQIYILPLLYGLLGASAYVLRSLNTEIRDLTYVVESNISYRLRIQLGALSGLAIGWFTIPETSSSVSSSSFGTLSPLALAFLAGYSVEILFSGMDRLISKFSTAQTDMASASTKSPAVKKPDESENG